MVYLPMIVSVLMHSPTFSAHRAAAMTRVYTATTQPWALATIEYVLPILGQMFLPAVLLPTGAAFAVYAFFSCVLGHVVRRRVYDVHPIRDTTSVEEVDAAGAAVMVDQFKVRDERHLEHRHSKLDKRPYEVVDFESWSTHPTLVARLGLITAVLTCVFKLWLDVTLTPLQLSIALVWGPAVLYHVWAYCGYNNVAMWIVRLSLLRFATLHTHLCCPTSYLTAQLTMSDSADASLRRSKLKQLSTLNVSDMRLSEYVASAIKLYDLVNPGVNQSFSPASAPNPEWRPASR